MSIRFIISTAILLSSFVSFGQKKSSKTQFPLHQTTGWKVHTDTTIGYSIQFPAKWHGTVGAGGFFCGKKPGFRDAQWSVIIVATDDAEGKEMWFGEEELTTGIFEEIKKTKKNIIINGIEAQYLLETHKKWADMYSESIYLKTDTYWYFISNDGEKDERFQQFYKSFKLIR